jgi:hypothetical protein
MTTAKAWWELLRDSPDNMPDWVHDVLTPGQANELQTSALFRWQRLVGASELPGPSKSVALWIVSHCSSTRLECYPSTRTLAAESGFHRKSVERAIVALEAAGWIYTWRSGPNERRVRNHYAPCWPQRQTVAPEVPRCGAVSRSGEPCRQRVPNADSPCHTHRSAMSPDEHFWPLVGAESTNVGAESTSSGCGEHPLSGCGEHPEGTREGTNSKELLEGATRQNEASGPNGFPISETSSSPTDSDLLEPSFNYAVEKEGEQFDWWAETPAIGGWEAEERAESFESGFAA